MTARLVVFAPNWLGDAVMALPALAQLGAAWPGTTIDVAARPAVAPLFSMVPSIGRTLVLADRRASVVALGEGRYEAAVLLPNSLNAARLAWSAGIPERWGYRSDFRSLFLTRGVTRPDRVHQSEYYRHLVGALGFGGDRVEPRLVVTDDRREAGRRLLEAEGWDGRAPLVAMAPGAAFGGAKRWPARSFASVADALADGDVRLALVGSAADEGQVAQVVSAAKRGTRPINLAGRTDLATLAGVLVHCRALVTNDSGAMHLAAALGVNVTALFGPTRERETHPIGPARHTVLTHPVWCRPCMLRECPLTQGCMTGITADQVLDATRRFLP